eukprot:6214487-Pleurochrysis_carterae.AAC.2
MRARVHARRNTGRRSQQTGRKRSSQVVKKYTDCLCEISVAQMTKHDKCHQIAVLARTIRIEVARYVSRSEAALDMLERTLFTRRKTSLSLPRVASVHHASRLA